MSVSAKTKQFTYRTEKDGPEYKREYVSGFLRQLWLQWDEGRPNQDPKKSIPARWEIHIMLDEQSLGPVKIDVGAASTAYVLAAQLNQTSRDSWVGITLRQSDGDACLTEVSVWDGSNWHAIFTPKSDGSPIQERLWEQLKEMSTHSAYREPENPKDTVAPLLWSRRVATQPSTPPTTPPPAFSGSAEGGANPSSHAPGQSSERGTGGSEAEKPDGKAWDVGIDKWPKPESWNEAADDQRFSALIGEFHKREVYDQPLMIAVAESIVCEYHKALPEPFKSQVRFTPDVTVPDAKLNRGAVLLAVQFLKAANGEQFAKALDAGEELKDPFADD